MSKISFLSKEWKLSNELRYNMAESLVEMLNEEKLTWDEVLNLVGEDDKEFHD